MTFLLVQSKQYIVIQKKSVFPFKDDSLYAAVLYYVSL